MRLTFCQKAVAAPECAKLDTATIVCKVSLPQLPERPRPRADAHKVHQLAGDNVHETILFLHNNVGGVGKDLGDLGQLVYYLSLANGGKDLAIHPVLKHLRGWHGALCNELVQTGLIHVHLLSLMVAKDATRKHLL